MNLKLGKLPARPGAVKLQLKKYINLSRLPTPPAEFGHEDLVSDWGMLGNDQYGDCVWAGAAHETMLWNAESGKVVDFTTENCLAAYSAVTGFNPDNLDSDRGTDMQVAAAYRQKTGLTDATGNVHRVGMYLAITAGDIEEHLVAAYLFGAVGCGVLVPQSAMDQFNAGQPWTLVPGSPNEGGHYVPFLAHRNEMLRFCTWGSGKQDATIDWFCEKNDESIVYLSSEILKDGKSLEGFDWDQLQADYNDLTQS